MNEHNPHSPDLKSATGLGADYAAPALERVRAAVRGNGIKPETVRLKKLEGEVVEFNAKTSLMLRTRTMERIIGGKKTGPEKCANPQGVRDAIERERMRILSSPDIIGNIQALVLERKDRGFGTRNEIIKLPFLTKEYVHYQPCSACKAEGNIKCQRCHGKGQEICPRCNGQSMEICPQCRGTQLIFNGNAKIPCPKCNGQGRAPCQMCNQTRRIPCSACKTRGAMICQNCNGQAWHSYITTAEIDVIGTYSYDRDNVPAALRETIEARAKDLPLYADIAVPPIQAQREGTQSDEIPLRYNVRLPYAQVEFSLGKDQSINSLLLGRQGEIVNMPDFLEPLLKRGMQTLHQAAEKQGDVARKMHKAGQYRTIRQAIIAAAKYPKGKAARLLIKNTPLGLGKSAIKTLIVDADAALKNITSKPRRNGVFAGALFAGIFYAAYMLTGLRAMLAAFTPDEYIHIGIDGAALGIGMMISVFTVQLFGVDALKKALDKLLPPEQKNAILPKAGYSGLWSALLCFGMFLLVCEGAFYMNAAPGWYAAIRVGIM